MKMFNKIIMSSEFDVNMLKTGVFFDETDHAAAVEDGAFVTIKDLMPHDLYKGMKDLNARKVTAFDADSSCKKMFGFIDYVGVSHADVMGVNYRIGDKIAGCSPVAEERVRVRVPALGDEFYLGNENFSGAIKVGVYALPEDGKTTLKVTEKEAAVEAMNAPGLVIYVEDAKDLIMGQVNEGSKLYRCRVVSL